MPDSIAREITRRLRIFLRQHAIVVIRVLLSRRYLVKQIKDWYKRQKWQMSPYKKTPSETKVDGFGNFPFSINTCRQLHRKRNKKSRTWSLFLSRRLCNRAGWQPQSHRQKHQHCNCWFCAASSSFSDALASSSPTTSWHSAGYRLTKYHTGQCCRWNLALQDNKHSPTDHRVCQIACFWLHAGCSCIRSSCKAAVSVWRARLARSRLARSRRARSRIASDISFDISMRAHSHEARNACFCDPKNRPHVGHVCQSLGFAHKIQCIELKPARPGTGDHE